MFLSAKYFKENTRAIKLDVLLGVTVNGFLILSNSEAHLQIIGISAGITNLGHIYKTSIKSHFAEIVR